MPLYTNNAPGLRGVNMKDGSTVWIEPGASVELNKADVKKATADIEEGSKTAKPKGDDGKE